MARLAVAITGGVASGKSEACRGFARLGVAIADADLVAREVVAPGQAALAEIIAHFGPGMVQADGELDRAAMRQRVFQDPVARRQLEAITHPPIRARLKALAEAAEGDYVLVAIPLLAEGGGWTAYPWLDRILVVDTPLPRQRERLLARDRIDAELAEKMIAAQASRAQRLALASDVLVNDGDLAALEAAVARLDRYYRRLAHAHPCKPGTI